MITSIKYNCHHIQTAYSINELALILFNPPGIQIMVQKTSSFLSIALAMVLPGLLHASVTDHHLTQELDSNSDVVKKEGASPDSSIKTSNFLDEEGNRIQAITTKKANQTIIEYFDHENKPCLFNILGAAKMEIDRNPATGEPSEIRFFGLDGNPINSKHGTAVERIIKTPRGKNTSTLLQYFDAAGKPTQFDGRLPWHEMIEDDKGHALELSFMDGNKHPVNISAGGFVFAKAIYQGDFVQLFDRSGNKIKELKTDIFEEIIFNFFHPFLLNDLKEIQQQIDAACKKLKSIMFKHHSKLQLLIGIPLCFHKLDIAIHPLFCIVLRNFAIFYSN